MIDPFVFHGQITTRRRLFWQALANICPGMVWMLVFMIVPACLVGILSLVTRGPDGQILWIFTSKNFERLAGFGIFGWSPVYFVILGRSIWAAFWVTAACVFLSYPLALYINGLGKRGRLVALSCIVIPMCTNLVIRTYAWELLLSPQLPLAQLAAYFGWLEEGRALYPSTLAVYLGMVSYSLPYALLPLYTSVERMDGSVVEAARDLYASEIRVFRTAILPQTRPGLSVAILMTFVPTMGMFVITNRLGGANYMLVGNLIQQQFGSSRDYPFGAAISLVLILITLVGLYFYRKQGNQVVLP